MILSVILGIVCVIYVLPVLAVLINSFKLNTFVKTDTFAMPTGEMWAGMDDLVKGMTFGNYPFWDSVKYSVVITVLSMALILLAIIPVIIFYLACQKHIIKGVAAGAVKG